MSNIDRILDGKTHRLLSIKPTASVYEALCAMALYDIGALAVLDAEDRLVGMFSERDYARKVILLGKRSKEVLVAEIMVKRFPTVGPGAALDACMALMTEKRTRHLPVVDAERVLGIISLGDVVKEVIAEQRHVITELENYLHR